MKKLILALCIAALGAPTPAQDHATSKPTSQPEVRWTAVKTPLATCVVSGEPLEADSKRMFEAGGRTFSTCCGRCKTKVEGSPEAYVEKLDAAIAKAQNAHYPLDRCPISGEEISTDAKLLVLEDTLVKLCCGGCVSKARARGPELAAMVVAKAYQHQVASYPVAKCAVSQDEFDAEDAVDVMVGTQLIRLCCDHCVEDVQKNPAKFAAKIAAASAAKKSPHGDLPSSRPSGAEHGKQGHDGERGGPRDAGSDAASGSGCCAGQSTGCCAEKATKPSCCSATSPAKTRG
ncbi:MAG: hypothetical protein AAF628_30050 [Planctomycetota bacterium]